MREILDAKAACFVYAMEPFETSEIYSSIPGGGILLNWLGNILAAIRGVPIFFGISAFLICHSIEHSMSLKNYLKKRFLRIFPELWLSTMVNVLCVTLLGFFSKDLLVWAVMQCVGVPFTPGSFKNFASGSLNGAMWTIAVLIQMYIVLYFAWNI